MSKNAAPGVTTFIASDTSSPHQTEREKIALEFMASKKLGQDRKGLSFFMLTCADVPRQPPNA